MGHVGKILIARGYLAAVNSHDGHGSKSHYAPHMTK